MKMKKWNLKCPGINFGIKTFVPIFLLFLVLIAIEGYYTISSKNDHDKELLVQQNRAQISEIKAIIQNEFYQIDQDLFFLKYLLENQLRQNISAASVNSAFIEFARSKGKYDQLRYLSRDGQERIRVNYNNGGTDGWANLGGKRNRQREHIFLYCGVQTGPSWRM